MKPLLAACLLLAAVPASGQDPRISIRRYDPGQVVTVHGRTGIQSTIEFGEGEHIENVAIGDSAAWQVTPNKRASLLFVKPMQAPVRSNMTVVTDRRTYLFDLVASPGAAPVYVMRFLYPPEPKPAPAPVVVAAAPPPKATPADLNFAWASDGASQLLPARVFDDGRSTWLAWGHDATLPAILVREPNGAEGPVNYTVKGDYIVVDGVPPQLVLRQGKQIATLTPAPRPARPEPAPALPEAAAVAQPAAAQPAAGTPAAPPPASTTRTASAGR
jgi:type IV secretion system protein VirB9